MALKIFKIRSSMSLKATFVYTKMFFVTTIDAIVVTKETIVVKTGSFVITIEAIVTIIDFL